MRKVLLAFTLLAVCASPLAAQTTPSRGSPLRARLMTALRPVIEAQIGAPVEFVVRTLRVLDPWAYLHVVPQRPGNGSIDWDRTKFREDMRQGRMSDGTMALLRRSGDRWRVVEYAIGPSDIAWDGWVAPHKVPRKVFTDE